jgi:hypothetical protein
MATEKKEKKVKVRDLKPSKDAKGGGGGRNQAAHNLQGAQGAHRLYGAQGLHGPQGASKQN